MLHRILCLAMLLGTAAAASAQVGAPSVIPGRRCFTVADSVRGPTPGQLAERQDLRDRLIAVGRRNGITQPRGLLLADVAADGTRQVLFMESNYPPEGVTQATTEVEEYLASLPAGVQYQALIRVDGEYPLMRGGRQHCPPVLFTSDDERAAMRRAAERAHPEAGQRRVTGSAVILLVVSRDGNVVMSALARGSGDDYLDMAAREIGTRLRFAPATLDGVPFDTRIRMPFGFEVDD